MRARLPAFSTPSAFLPLERRHPGRLPRQNGTKGPGECGGKPGLGKTHLHIPDAHAAIHASSAELRALGLTPAEHRDLAAKMTRVYGSQPVLNSSPTCPPGALGGTDFSESWGLLAGTAWGRAVQDHRVGLTGVGTAVVFKAQRAAQATGTR